MASWPKHPMAGLRWREVGSVRNTGPKACVRTSLIVVRDPLPEDLAKVTLIERHHPVQAFAPNRANHAFAERVRSRRSDRCLENGEPSAAIVRSTPSE